MYGGNEYAPTVYAAKQKKTPQMGCLKIQKHYGMLLLPLINIIVSGKTTMAWEVSISEGHPPNHFVNSKKACPPLQGLQPHSHLDEYLFLPVKKLKKI